MSDSLPHYRLQSARLLCSWNSPGKNIETIKLLEENIGKTLSDINHCRILYDPLPRVMEIKAKINKWNLIKFLHNKGNYKQGEKTAFRMGEYNSK